MKHKDTISKTQVLKALAQRGISMNRVTVANGRREWALSNGMIFSDLKTVAAFAGVDTHGKIANDIPVKVATAVAVQKGVEQAAQEGEKDDHSA